MKLLVIDKKSVICMILSLLIAIIIPVGTNFAMPAAVSERPLPIYSVERNDKWIAVTFDSAWGNEDLDEILTTLEAYGCKATYFVVGDFLEKYPDSVKKMNEKGHEVANHSDTHAHYSKLSRQEIIADMDACDKKIKALTGKDNVLFRPPYGEYTDLSVTLCNETGRYSIQWDVETPATASSVFSVSLKQTDNVLF